MLEHYSDNPAQGVTDADARLFGPDVATGKVGARFMQTSASIKPTVGRKVIWCAPHCHSEREAIDWVLAVRSRYLSITKA